MRRIFNLTPKCQSVNGVLLWYSLAGFSWYVDIRGREKNVWLEFVAVTESRGWVYLAFRSWHYAKTLRFSTQQGKHVKLWNKFFFPCSVLGTIVALTTCLDQPPWPPDSLKVQYENWFSFSPAQLSTKTWKHHQVWQNTVGRCRQWKMMRETGMLLYFFLDGSFSHAFLTLCYQDYHETETSEHIWACYQLFPTSIVKLLLWLNFLHKSHETCFSRKLGVEAIMSTMSDIYCRILYFL